MKRAIALIMVLAMILSLAACGGGAGQPSGDSTPPVTQGPQNQPGTNPDSTQPGEPANTAPNGPESNPGATSIGAIPLYDGIHYLVLPPLSPRLPGSSAARATP